MLSARIVCHMQVSLDGRINGTVFDAPPSCGDGEYYDILNKEFGTPFGVIGRKTVEGSVEMLDVETLPTPAAAVPKGDFWDDLSSTNKQRCMGVVDPRGVAAFKTQKPTEKSVPAMLEYRLVSLLAEDTASDALLAHLRATHVPYIFAGKDGLDLRVVAAKIKETLGEDTLTLCGGGLINGTALGRGQVDELSLVYMPTISGNPSDRSLAEAPPELAPAVVATEWTVKSVEVLKGNYVWLRYNKK